MIGFLGCGLLLSFTGCDSDKDADLPGTWVAQEVMVTNSEGEFAEEDLPDTYTEVLQINEDLTYTGSWTQNGGSGSDSGTLTVEDGILVFTSENGTSESIPFVISGNQLILFTPVSGGAAEITYRKSS